MYICNFNKSFLSLVHLWILTYIATFNVGNVIHRQNLDLVPPYLQPRLMQLLVLNYYRPSLMHLQNLVEQLQFRLKILRNCYLKTVTFHQ